MSGEVQLQHLQCVLCVFIHWQPCHVFTVLKNTCWNMHRCIRSLLLKYIRALFTSCTKLFDAVFDFHRSKWWLNELDGRESGCSGVCIEKSRASLYRSCHLMHPGLVLAFQQLHNVPTVRDLSVGIVALLFCTAEDGECRNKPAVDISTTVPQYTSFCLQDVCMYGQFPYGKMHSQVKLFFFLNFFSLFLFFSQPFHIKKSMNSFQRSYNRGSHILYIL